MAQRDTAIRMALMQRRTEVLSLLHNESPLTHTLLPSSSPLPPISQTRASAVRPSPSSPDEFFSSLKPFRELVAPKPPDTTQTLRALLHLEQQEAEARDALEAAALNEILPLALDLLVMHETHCRTALISRAYHTIASIRACAFGFIEAWRDAAARFETIAAEARARSALSVSLRLGVLVGTELHRLMRLETSHRLSIKGNDSHALPS